MNGSYKVRVNSDIEKKARDMGMIYPDEVKVKEE